MLGGRGGEGGMDVLKVRYLRERTFRWADKTNVNWAKYVNRKFIREKIQMGNKCSILLLI